jgi:hypothetical protein
LVEMVRTMRRKETETLGKMERTSSATALSHPLAR